MIGYNNYTDYTSACQLLELETLQDRRAVAFRKLASDILAGPAHCLYPAEQLVTEGRPLRRQRTFVTPRCNTERYRKSPLAALISLMNNMQTHLYLSSYSSRTTVRLYSRTYGFFPFRVPVLSRVVVAYLYLCCRVLLTCICAAAYC